MSARDVEIVRGMYDRREGGDMYVGEYIHPEIEFVRIGSEAPDFTGVWHGKGGMRQATADYLNVWEDYRFEVDRMIDLGDRVLVLERQTARGRRSGAVISQDVGTLLTLRDGLIVRWEYYWERAEALEAAGVREYASSGSRRSPSMVARTRGASAIAAMSKRT